MKEELDDDTPFMVIDFFQPGNTVGDDTGRDDGIGFQSAGALIGDDTGGGDTVGGDDHSADAVIGDDTGGGDTVGGDDQSADALIGDETGGEGGIGDAIPQDANYGFNGNAYHNVSAYLLIRTGAMKQCNAITLSRIFRDPKREPYLAHSKSIKQY